MRKYLYTVKNLFFPSKSMANMSLKYSGANLWDSIDICELWNSLLGFWELFQTIAKDNNLWKVDVKVNGAEPWCFDVWLSIDTDTLVWWISIAWGLISMLVNIIDLKKFLKWKPARNTQMNSDWSFTITNEDWASTIVQKNTYNTFNNCEVKIWKCLSEAFSPLWDNWLVQNISIWAVDWENRDELVSVDESEVSFFSSWIPESQIIEWMVLQGRVVTMNIDTYWWTIEYMGKKEYIDFSKLKFSEEAMRAINESMMNKTDVVVKCNVEYERGKIRYITILWVIPLTIFENI